LRIEGRDFNRHFGPRPGEEFLDVRCRRAERGLQRQPRGGVGRAVAGGVDGDDSIGVNRALALEQPGEGAPDVTIADQRESQKLSVSTNVANWLSRSAFFLRASSRRPC